MESIGDQAKLVMGIGMARDESVIFGSIWLSLTLSFSLVPPRSSRIHLPPLHLTQYKVSYRRYVIL